MSITHAIDLCIVMPAYNEEGCIEQVIDGWIRFLSARESSWNIVVVNDGSRDGTGALLDSIAAREPRIKPIHQKNAGHGRALVKGYEEALKLSPVWIFQIDSDDQFEITDFEKLWAKRHESRFITGRRLERHDALHRLVITRVLRLVNLIIFGSYIPDTNIPFRLIRADYLARLLPLIPPQAFAPNIFLAVLAHCAGENLFQIPVVHKDRQTGTVSLVKWGLIKACFRSAKELALFRLSLRQSIRELQKEQ